MKTILALVLIALALTTQATPETMMLECQRQMAMGTCIAANDITVYAITDYVLISGVGRVNRNAYNRVRSGKDDMCPLARDYCINAPNGDECKAAQAMWGR